MDKIPYSDGNCESTYGEFDLEVNNLKNRLAIREKEKALRNWIRRETSRRGISIMWKFGRKTWQRLSKKLKCSLINYKMRMRSSRVAQDG